MSSITIDSIRQIVSATLDQFSEAVFLLQAVHDGRSSQAEVASFLRKVGVMSDAESEKAQQDKDMLLAGHVLSLLKSDVPIGGIAERVWASPARGLLLEVIGHGMPLHYLRTIVEEGTNEMWLVGQTLKRWQSWSLEIPGRASPTQADRANVITIVQTVLREVRQ